MIAYQNYNCIELSNNCITLLITRSVGPRIIALKVNGGENLFAELPKVTLDCPGKGKFHFYGGHRLWHAPEDPRRTYIPDDDPVEILPLENGIHTRQAVELETGIRKEMKIHLDAERPLVEIEHLLTNQGLWSVTCAPWAITQFKPGGVAILPQNRSLLNHNPTLPNRSLALWPYTNINSPHISWGNEYILIRAEMQNEQLKIGFPNPRGWLAYWRDQTLFVKRAVYQPLADYVDLGSSSECYCDDRFLELETLGPSATLQPGVTISHSETWEIYSNVTLPKVLDDLIRNF
ncbi:MAG: hypothetical protein JW726_03490 [Anaerolineales bacterium]|nr:hypothetical protein [Anaerolineales bacterium]